MERIASTATALLLVLSNGAIGGHQTTAVIVKSSSSSSLLSSSSSVLPVVAVFAYPSRSSRPQCGGSCEYVSAAYVKWLESNGARSFPVSYDSSPEVLKVVMDNVNGLLLPGGNPDIPDGARWAIEYAKKINEEGDFFPVWGTCLGWEWTAQALSGDDAVLSDGFDGLNMTRPFGILPGANDSRMLSGLSPNLLEKALTEPLTANNHSEAVTPEDFYASVLPEMLRVLAISSDRLGRAYVSAVEAFDWPIYGVQWHPEKSQYEWGLDPDGTPHSVVNHTVEAIQLSQGLSTFFVSETRRNHHVMADVMEWEPFMFHNREVAAAGPSIDHIYYLHFSGQEFLQGEDKSGRAVESR